MGGGSQPYGESAASYRAQAAAVKTGIDSAFWLSGKGRLMTARDVDGVVRDVGHVGLNLEAVFYDAVSSSRADAILDWVAGDRVVSGDMSQGADIYHWDFGPRTSTLDASDWYIWPMYQWFGINLNQGPGARWNEQIQNGGGWFWQSFYDVVDRVRHRGPDDAWDRLTEILDWYQATRNAGGFVSYYQGHEGNLQGCGTAGNVGLDCEFIENTLVPLSFLYDFLGYDATRPQPGAGDPLAADLHRRRAAALQKAFLRRHRPRRSQPAAGDRDLSRDRHRRLRQRAAQPAAQARLPAGQPHLQALRAHGHQRDHHGHRGQQRPGRPDHHPRPAGQRPRDGDLGTVATGVIGEVSSVSVSHQEVAVNFSRAYSNPVVIAQPPSFADAGPAVARITGVTATGATLYVQEAPNPNLVAHAFETVSYLVLEAGSWELADGTRLEAGKLSMNQSVGRGVASTWAQITFANGLPSAGPPPAAPTRL